MQAIRERREVEIKLSGLVKKTGPFTGKIGAALTLANAMPSHMQSSGGTTVIKQISRALNNEDFEKTPQTDCGETPQPRCRAGFWGW